MQKSYVKVDRQRGRVIRSEVDPHLGKLLYSEPAPAEVEPAPLTIADEHLGLLIVTPDAAGNPRRTLAPPLCRSAKVEGGK